MQLKIENWAVVVTYLTVLVVIGIVASRRVKDTDEYFLESGTLVSLLHPIRGARGIKFGEAYKENLNGFFVSSALSAALVASVWLAPKM